MEEKVIWILWAVGAYLIGSIPFGFLVGKMRGKDIRTLGSKNIGATNVYRVVGKPWGILACNLTGCFLIGALSVVLTRHCSAETQLVVITGFLGAFTTFSTYALDTVVLIEQTRYAVAFTNLLLHNVLGIAMAFVGLALGRFLIRG